MNIDEIRAEHDGKLRTFRIRIEVVRLDHVRAVFYENVMAGSSSAARAIVDHYRTSAPAPLSFASEVMCVYENGDPAIPPKDPYHPDNWMTITIGTETQRESKDKEARVLNAMQEQAEADASPYFRCHQDSSRVERLPATSPAVRPRWKCVKCGRVYDEHCDKGLSVPEAMFSSCTALCDL